MADSAVVIQAGARDNYQVPYALDEGRLLAGLVTNVYSRAYAHKQYQVDIVAPVNVSTAGAAAYVMSKIANVSHLYDWSDRALGRLGRRLAYAQKAPLLSYSYYAYEAFREGPGRPTKRILFQLHPHPVTVRRILLEELERWPIARYSLTRETELRLPPDAFDRMSAESGLSTACIAASKYTASTLIENGCDPRKIAVVPYGVDPQHFLPRSPEAWPTGPFTIAFVGSITQRKGIVYLLEAMRRLKSRKIRLLLRGRGLVDHAVLKHYSDVQADIILDLPREELVRDLHAAHLFVLPSVTEGFGHVLVQAMSCGLPVISTENTAAPDLITDGFGGIILKPRDIDGLASAIEWGITHTTDLRDMGNAARASVQRLTWQRFREGIRDAFVRLCAESE